MVKENIQLIVDSSYRLNTYENNSTFSYAIPRNIYGITEIVLNNIQIPYTFYYINSTNNVLRVNKGGIQSVTITAGNYTASSLATELTTQLNATFVGSAFVVLFSSATLKLTITNSVAFIVYSSADDSLSTIAPILGFSSTSVSALSTVAPSCLDISGPNYVLIHSVKLVENNVDVKPQFFSNTSLTNTLFKITPAKSLIKINLSSTDYSFTIPAGNYTSTKLSIKIQETLNKITGQTFACSYSNITSKFTITNGTAFILYKLGIATTIGFNYTTTSATSQVGDVGVSPTLNVPTYNDVLFIIPINVGFGGYISAGETESSNVIVRSKTFNILKNTSIDFYLTDEYNQPLDLNGVNWLMNVVFLTE